MSGWRRYGVRGLFGGWEVSGENESSASEAGWCGAEFGCFW